MPAKKCKYEKALRRLVKDNQEFIRWLDAEIMKPSTPERGRRFAVAVNALEMAVDRVRYGALGVDFRRDRKPTSGR